jgi:hypothetical protein
MTLATGVGAIAADIGICRRGLPVGGLAVIGTTEMAAGTGVFHLAFCALYGLFYVTLAHHVLQLLGLVTVFPTHLSKICSPKNETA